MCEEIRKYNVQLVQKALTQNRGLKSAKLKTKEGKSLMVAIQNKDGSITTNRDKIVERCAEFYRELYSSTADRPTIQTSAEDSVPEVLSAEVQHAVKQMKNNKGTGDGGGEIDIVKEGGIVQTVIEIIYQLSQAKDHTKRMEQCNYHTTP